MSQIDRRVQRSRELLQEAMIELINERGYSDITIQDIVDRANLGRTTFYLHFGSKEDLFMTCHEAMIKDFQLGMIGKHPLSREELISSETPAWMVTAYEHLKSSWQHLSPIFQSKDGPYILRRIRDSSAQEIEANLRVVFSDMESSIPLDILASYLAGARIALMQWWLEKRQSQSAAELAQMFHRLESAAIRDAFGL